MRNELQIYEKKVAKGGTLKSEDSNIKKAASLHWSFKYSKNKKRWSCITILNKSKILFTSLTEKVGFEPTRAVNP